MSKNTKTEHAGAKNGGGFWGTRKEAKTLSKRQRRVREKDEIQKELKELNKIPAKIFLDLTRKLLQNIF